MSLLRRSKPRYRRAQLVTGLRRVLRGRCDAAYLFGSYARGDAHAHSDVDLIVVARTPRPFPERFRDYASVIRDYAPVDLIVYTPEEWQAFKRCPNPLVAEARRDWVNVLGPRA